MCFSLFKKDKRKPEKGKPASKPKPKKTKKTKAKKQRPETPPWTSPIEDFPACPPTDPTQFYPMSSNGSLILPGELRGDKRKYQRAKYHEHQTKYKPNWHQRPNRGTDWATVPYVEPDLAGIQDLERRTRHLAGGDRSLMHPSTDDSTDCDSTRSRPVKWYR